MSVVLSWLAAAVMAVVLTGCADDPSPTMPEESSVDETDPTPASAAPPPGSDSPVVRQAAAALAKRLGVEVIEVEVVDVEEVTWRDGSRGCARIDVMYTQALIDGSRITLRVGETTYEYHTGGSGPPSLCENPTE